MAINIKHLICDTFLHLIEEKSIQNITIKNILDASNVSKQSFYNHFMDKNDLIQYIYDEYIVGEFDGDFSHFYFRDALLNSFYKMKDYRLFLKQACKLEGQNCLKDHITKHCEEFDLKWHQYLYGKKEMSEALRFATIYHANASSAMTLSWILSDMVVSVEDMVDMIVSMRAIGMDVLFSEGESQNPYNL